MTAPADASEQRKAPLANSVGPPIQADPDRTARAITGKSGAAVKAPSVQLRHGVVTAVDIPNARVDVALGGDTISIPGVAHLSNYRPTLNDSVTVMVNGPDLLVLDRTIVGGPSVISGAKIQRISAYEQRSSTVFGDLATFGPSVTTSVAPSRRLLVGVSCSCYTTVAGDGGDMSFELSGASVLAAQDGEALSNYTATVNTYVLATHVSYLDFLNPGTTTVTAKYASLGGKAAYWGVRQLFAIPL